MLKEGRTDDFLMQQYLPHSIGGSGVPETWEIIGILDFAELGGGIRREKSPEKISRKVTLDAY